MKMNFKKYTLTAFVSGLALTAIGQSQKTYPLDFSGNRYQVKEVAVAGNTFQVRAFENIVYVGKPVDTNVQVMNIYIPEAYFQGKLVGRYSAATAPVFFPNQVGGYMPARPASLPSTANTRESALQVALSKGYVVASAGARGRTSQDNNGRHTGKSPAALVDLKAAIRYLKFNDKKMPGNAAKIITNGTSAGGAMSALLGATGNNADFIPFLKALGAAEAEDDVFAVSAYCPITNLDHADMAYEWQFNGLNTYQQRGRPSASAQAVNLLNDAQIKVSAELKSLFPAYVNALKLKANDGKLLSLDDSGEGNFKELVKSYVIASAQKAMDSGADLSEHQWLTVISGKVINLDFQGYVRYMERMKTPPAFDALDLSSPENQEFGDETIDKKHFTGFSLARATTTAVLADLAAVKMLNPMNYIGQPKTNTATHWRIRHGAKDKDTGLAIPVLLATTLKNKGYEVDLELPWDKPHSGDYDLDELFQWMGAISR